MVSFAWLQTHTYLKDSLLGLMNVYSKFENDDLKNKRWCYDLTLAGWKEKRTIHALLWVPHRKPSSQKNWWIQFNNNWTYNDYGKYINWLFLFPLSTSSKGRAHCSGGCFQTWCLFSERGRFRHLPRLHPSAHEPITSYQHHCGGTTTLNIWVSCRTEIWRRSEGMTLALEYINKNTSLVCAQNGLYQAFCSNGIENNLTENFPCKREVD